MLLLIDRKRMRLPLRLACSVGRPAYIRGEEAAGRHAERFRPEQHGKAGMVGQVAPNRKVGDDIDPERLQPFGWTDA